MAMYAYKAMNLDGRLVRGEMEAANLVDLEMRLKRQELDFITGRTLRHSRHFGGRIPLRERIHFCFHLEQLSRAGVPLVESLTDLRAATDNNRFRQIIGQIIESIQGGRALSQALAEHPRVFDAVFCALVRAGESSGNLPDVLKELTESAKRDDELSAYTQKLVVYPAFVAGATVLAVFVAMIYVVPEVSKLFRAAGQNLPFETRVLVAVSGAITHYWWLMLIGAAALFGAVATAVRMNVGAARRWDAVKLAIPLYGPVYRKIILARFGNLFAMMYSSGIAIIDIIRVAQDVAGNLVMRQALLRAEQLISEGQNVTAAFSRVGLFPPLVIRMLRVGENTGSLDVALRNVSYFYDRDVRESIARAQAALEPTMILILGAIMMWVALAILGPIYDIITRMKV
jgi:type IV pilus assembly protein PilC